MKAAINTKQTMILWVVWFALFSSLFAYLFVLWPAARGAGSSAPAVLMLPMLITPAGISVFLRWFVIPGVATPQAVIITSIIGLALAESLTFYGIFLFSDYFQLFFLVSVFMVLQYIPLYAMKSQSGPPAVRDLTQS